MIQDLYAIVEPVKIYCERDKCFVCTFGVKYFGNQCTIRGVFFGDAVRWRRFFSIQHLFCARTSGVFNWNHVLPLYIQVQVSDMRYVLAIIQGILMFNSINLLKWVSLEWTIRLNLIVKR